MTRQKILPCLVLFLSAYAAPVWADCVTPAAVAGDQIYNTAFNVMQFCNGSRWINMGAPGSSGTLTAARNFSITGDATAPAVSFDGSAPVALAATVGKIQGFAVATTTPTAAQVLMWSATNSTWQPTTYAMPSGTAAAPGLAFTSDATTGFYLPAAGALAVSTGGAERLRVTASGVGVGTTPTTAQLTIAGAGTGVAMIGGSSFCGANYSGVGLNGIAPDCYNYNILSSSTDQELYLNRPTGHAIRFRMNNADQMVLTSTGSVGIGTTAPTQALSVTGNETVSGTLTTDSLVGTTATIGTLYTTTLSPANLAATTGTVTTLNSTTGTITNLAATTATIGTLYSTTLSPTNLVATTGTVTTLKSTTATITNLAATTATMTNATITGVAYLADGTAALPSLAFAADTNTGLFRAAADVLAISTGGTEWLRVTATGGVGIGTTTPGYPLDVNGNIRLSGTGLYNSSGYQIVAGNQNDWLRINQNASWPNGVAAYGNWAFGAGGVAIGGWTNPGAGNLTVTGNVGIGTTTPSVSLDVAGRIRSQDYVETLSGLTGNLYYSAGWNYRNPGYAYYLSMRSDTAYAAMQVAPSGAVGAAASPSTSMVWTSTGSVGIGTTTPATMLNINNGSNYGTLMLGGNGGTSNHHIVQESNGSLVTYTGTFGAGSAQMTLTATGSVGIGTTTPDYALTLGTGSLGIANAAQLLAKNASGTFENFMFPRWTDNVMYLNYGANGFNVRNNSSTNTMFMTATNSVGIGTTTPRVSLDLGAKTDAILLPSGITTQRPATGVAGMMRFNTTTVGFEGYNGTSWGSLGGSTSGTSGQSMVAGWPDAIVCTASGSVTRYLIQGTHTHNDGNYYYITHDQTPTAYMIGFTSAGAYATHANMAGYDCVTNAYTIAQLTANGKAFNFVNSGNSAGAMADGTAAAPGLYFSADTNTGIYRPASGTIAFATSGTEKLRITSSGNVGIGVATPATKLDVAATQQATVSGIESTVTNNAISLTYTRGSSGGYEPGLIWRATDNAPAVPKAGIWLNDTASGTYLQFGTSNNYAAGITNSTAMTLDYLGNLMVQGNGTFVAGVGGQGLRINARASDSYTWGPIIFDSTGSTYVGGIAYTPTGASLNLGSSLTPVMSWYSNGNASMPGTLSQGSDLRLKKEIRPIETPLEKVSRLRGIIFYWKDKKKDPAEQIGVVAQEVQPVFPQLVSTDKNGMLSVNYSGFVAPLIEAVKELKARGDSLSEKLESRNAALKAENDALRAEIKAKDAAFAARLDALEARVK